MEKLKKLKTKFRILESIDNNTGISVFIPQRRFLFIFWKNYDYGEYGIARYDTLKEARSFFGESPNIDKGFSVRYYQVL